MESQKNGMKNMIWFSSDVFFILVCSYGCLLKHDKEHALVRDNEDDNDDDGEKGWLTHNETGCHI